MYNSMVTTDNKPTLPGARAMQSDRRLTLVTPADTVFHELYKGEK